MYVIAGVTGHVGSVVAEKLIAAGKKVKVIVRDAAKGASWSKRGAEVAVGGLEDASFLAGALKGASAFFVLLPPNYQATDFFTSQKKTSDAVAAAVKTSAVPHVVMLSSIGADLEAGTGPIKGLHYLENALRAAGTKLSAIRAGMFQENAGSAVGPAKAMGKYFNFMPSADYPIPMLATKDIGAVVVDALTNPPAKSEIVDVQGPAYSNRQVAEKLGTALGKKLDIVDVPAAGHVGALLQAGLSQTIAEAFSEMYAGFASGLVTPKGDRTVQGKTTLDEVMKTLVS